LTRIGEIALTGGRAVLGDVRVSVRMQCASAW